MKVNDIVKYSRPVDAIEAAMRFVVLEDNGNRFLIREALPSYDSLIDVAVETVANTDVELA